MRCHADPANVILRVQGKRNCKAKQFFSSCTRIVSQAKGTCHQLKVKVGDAITLDFCPAETFVVAEVEGYSGATQQK